MFASKWDRVSAVLIPVKGGKSYLANELKKYRSEGKRDLHVLDLDAHAEQHIAGLDKKINGVNWELTVFPTIKKLLKESLENFPKDDFLIICSNVKLVKYCKVGEKRQYAFMPGVKLYEQILGKFSPTSPAPSSTSGATDSKNLFAQANASAEGQTATTDTTTVGAADTSSANMDIFSRIILSRDSFTKAYGDCTRYSDMDDLVSKVVKLFNFNLIL